MISTPRLPLLLLCIGLVGLAACKTAAIYNVEAEPLRVSQSASVDEVGKAIRAASVRQGWEVKDVEPGKMTAMYIRGSHSAVVAIDYGTTQYRILYLDSENLRHDGTSIHRTYNLWVQRLEKAIDREVAFRLSDSGGPAVSAQE